jgi:hypothetical protein
VIRYDISVKQLETAVDALAPTWRKRAAKRTARFIKAGRYQEASAIWSEVKPAFMVAQMNKCVFCERQFETELYGKIEFDLEHFRPKSSVTAWPVVGRHAHTYQFATGNDSPNGYYWLAYALSNYAASCKSCNSNLKSNYFPIAGARTAVPGDLGPEQPYLCYPLGSGDADPETLITFVATTAVPKAAEGHDRRRAEVIIDFFELNTREELHRQRANMIIVLGTALKSLEAGGDDLDRELAERIVEKRFPHTNCLRAFRALWDDDRDLARRILAACKAYYAGAAGAKPPIV